MSQKVNTANTETLQSNDPLMEDFQRGQRTSRIKGFVALIGVVVAIAFLFIGFVQMGAV